MVYVSLPQNHIKYTRINLTNINVDMIILLVSDGLGPEAITFLQKLNQNRKEILFVEVVFNDGIIYSSRVECLIFFPITTLHKISPVFLFLNIINWRT